MDADMRSAIDWSVKNKFLVLLLALFAAVGGGLSMAQIPLDAIPDLSDVQVIIQTDYQGQAPQLVEDQVTYPIASEMLKVPGAKTVRGFSFFGVSFVYIIFDDGTDLYWARSRVLEYLSGIQGRLPEGADVALGPDATGWDGSTSTSWRTPQAPSPWPTSDPSRTGSFATRLTPSPG